MQAANALNRTKPMRKLLDKALGVHPDAWLPELASSRLRWSATPRRARAKAVTNGERIAPVSKVALFATCYVNYNEPGIGHDLLKVLSHNDVPWVIVERESCCGMPKLELGDLEVGREQALAREHSRARWVAMPREPLAGMRSSTAIPSCTLMFKQELPMLFPGRRRRGAGAKATRCSTRSST